MVMNGRTSDQAWRELLDQALLNGDLQRARSVVFSWLQAYRESLPPTPARSELRRPALFAALADVVERTHDDFLIEQIWQALDSIVLPQCADSVIPLIGVPVLNQVDRLAQMINSIDQDVETLAIVDNSGGDPSVGCFLERIVQEGVSGVRQVKVARNFGNAGVAASWNQLLTAFPEAPWALIVNDDVQFPAGVLSRLRTVMDSSRPLFCPLFPEADAFSAFALTTKTWDRIGLFDDSFYPAYFEDLEYRDRLRADPQIQWIDDPAIQTPMAQANPSRSATIGSDPELERFNRTSFAMNRLWYFSQRRLQNDRRGQWIRRWISAWQP